MDLFNSAFDAVLRFYFAAFSWAPPALGLAVLSAAVGVGMLWVFHKTSDQAGMKAAVGVDQVKLHIDCSLSTSAPG